MSPKLAIESRSDCTTRSGSVTLEADVSVSNPFGSGGASPFPYAGIAFSYIYTLSRVQYTKCPSLRANRTTVSLTPDNQRYVENRITEIQDANALDPANAPPGAFSVSVDRFVKTVDNLDLPTLINLVSVER